MTHKSGRMRPSVHFPISQSERRERKRKKIDNDELKIRLLSREYFRGRVPRTDLGLAK